MGEVRELGLKVNASGLAEARRRLERALQEFISRNAMPAKGSIHKSAATIAERIHGRHVGRPPGLSVPLTSSQATPLPELSPYLNHAGKPVMLMSVVLVVDELGSTSTMTSNLTDELLQERADLLANARYGFGGHHTADFESTAVYSDNLVYAGPEVGGLDMESRLGATLAVAAQYQFELACAGTLLRGGVALGMHHQSAMFVAGPALVEAHRLESVVADVPRIVLSLDAVRLARIGADYSFPPSISDYNWVLAVDADGETFISYLFVVLGEQAIVRNRLLRIHRNRIRAGLGSAPSGRPLAKWLWLKEYHDHFVVSNGLAPTLQVGQPSRAPRGFSCFVQ